MTNGMDDATRNQIESADPLRSTWLTANAGSGKTRVLTDRVARLLLAGTAPGRILCLTYTKAAATEMQNRLLKRLGEWAMLPEPSLREALAALGEDNAPDLAQARRLFARAIETPGGLKVQTIHSFCAAILRRFPLEAGVPMGFAELDDRSARTLRAEIIEEMAEAGDPAISELTTLHTGTDLDTFLTGLNEADFETSPDANAIWTAMGLPPGFDETGLLADVFTGEEADLFAALIPVLAKSGKNDAKLAAALKSVNCDEPSLEDVRILANALLTGKTAKSPFTAKIGDLPTKPLREGPCVPFMPALEDLMTRVQDARHKSLALTMARKTLALHRFGHAFTQGFAAKKAAHGWLDFDDLIRRTARLLDNSSMAQWVLWRLDGGIDHILVDEAQDTSPEQWRVIRSLTEEFTSGATIPGRNRTLFVVGDPKQSIYSFQGADIAVFEEMRAKFAEDFQAVQDPMQQKELAHSFRSSPAILSFVDAVFQGEAAQGLGAAPHHIAFRDQAPGRVDIWPPLPEPEQPEQGDWTDPVDKPAENAANTLLARAVAEQIKAIIGSPFMDPKSGEIRAIGPGDIQILVQRRSDLFNDLIRECKAANLPVAGADRLKLAAELAVRDITATLTVLATPEDSLSLAAALRSPLFGLSEDDLYRLATGEKRLLWENLLASKHQNALDILHDLMAQADFYRPYDLISRLLTRHDGRAALLARLGIEAEDGINELLSQALTYETTETPSLTGFLVWLASDDVTIKRQLPGGAGGLIRIMTVHGSKGLESPVVILPETQIRKPNNSIRTTRLENMPAWRGSKDDRPEALAEAVQKHTDQQEDEKRRLLYVAMTRAESWLIIAAAGKTGEGLESWHAMMTAGAERARGLTRENIEIDGIGTGLRLSFGRWPVEEITAERQNNPLPPLPDWVKCAAPPVIHPPRPIAATSLGGAKVIGAPIGDADPAEAMLRGTRLHLLMEHLPDAPPDQWPGLARNILAGAEGGLPDMAELEALIVEVQEVIAAPDLAEIMTPPADASVLREVSLTANLDGIGVLHGTVDRLIVSDDRVFAIDYKSNAQVPAQAASAPLGILRQMAAYRAALRAIYPGHVVESAVLWTATRSLMPLPDELLDEVMAGLDQSRPAS